MLVVSFFSAPVKRYGGGSFALKNLKEMTVTTSFLSLEEDVRKCEEGQTKAECYMEFFMKDIVRTCKCVPLNLKDFTEPGNNVNNLLKNLSSHSFYGFDR